MQKLVEKIEKLKKERNTIILAHNYQLPEVQDVADYRGDSLELSRIAAKTEAKVMPEKPKHKPQKPSMHSIMPPSRQR